MIKSIHKNNFTPQTHLYLLYATSSCKTPFYPPPPQLQEEFIYPEVSVYPVINSQKTPTMESSLTSPHDGLFYVLPYLALRELLTVQMVCRSARQAVDEDRLVWRQLKVEPPLSRRLTDHLLIKIASKSLGIMISLTLLDCSYITDSCLLNIVDCNRRISKLNLQGSSGLTPEGVIQAVKTLPRLQELRINGLLNINKDHLSTLNNLLGITNQPPLYYKGWQNSTSTNNQIDVTLCPRCGEGRIVYDCTREKCKQKGTDKHCRGCYWCVQRCEECGGCIGLGEVEEMANCSHLLCSACWLNQPRCSMCNRALCSGHLPFINPCQRCSDGDQVDEWYEEGI